MGCHVSADGSVNSFCASLDEKDRARLCARCVRREYKRGQTLFRDDYLASINILLEGMLVADAPFDEREFSLGRHPALSIMLPGDVFSCELICNPVEADSYRYHQEHVEVAAVAYANCVVGRLPLSEVKELFAESDDFPRKLFQRSIEMHGRDCEVASALRPGDTEASLKYLLCLADLHGVILTHQQLADISHRNRATVSKILAELPRNDPSFIAYIEELSAGKFPRE